MIYLAQADLQNAEIALQKLLLVNHQLQPAALNRGNAITGDIEASGKDITGFLVGSLQEGLDGARYVAVIGDDHLDFRVGGHDAGEGRHAEWMRSH